MHEAEPKENIVPVSTTDPSVEEFLKTLRAAARRRQREMNFLGAIGCFSMLGGASLIGHHLRDWGGVAGGLLIVFCTHLRLSGRTRRKQLAGLAVAQADARAVGPLLQMIQTERRQNPPPKEMIAAALILLPRLQSVNELSLQDRKTLADLLFPVWNPQFVMVGLQTVGRLQDSYARDAVRRLYTSSINNRYPDIYRLAETILPTLEERVEADKQHASLLRASSADALSADSLLRAADAHSQQTAPEELLRSVTPEPTTSTRSVSSCESTEAADVLQRSARSS